MKKVTIITTIVLMLAFVLPMARAQDKPATENSSTDPIKVEVQPSQTPETIEAGQDQNEPQAQEQLLQAKQALQAQLQQLEIQKQKLQQQLQALTQARQAEIQARQAEIQARQAEVQAKVKDKAVKVKASAEAHKAETEAEHWEQYAKKMEAWARQYEAHMNSPEVREHYKRLADNWVDSDQFKQWQKDMESWSKQWTDSDEFKQWQKEMQQWSEELAEAHAQAESGDHEHEPHPMPAMPPMPVMPAMPSMPVEIVTPDVVATAPMALPVTMAPAPPQPPTVVVPKVEPPAEIVAPAPVLPNITGAQSDSTPNIKIEKDKDGKFNATKEMHFVAKVKSGIPFIVRNSLGNITLKPSKDDTCDVRAVIRAKAKKDAEAQQMVEQVGMNIESTNERYYLKPVKPDGDKWNKLNVDLYIAVPVSVRPDVKTDLGNIDLVELKGNIKAFTKLGNVKAFNTSGNIDLSTDLGNVEFIAPKVMADGDIKLYTKMGDIEFVTPRDLSAKLMVQTKMGEIKSELPLEINRADMFKSTAEGTIGSGQANIKMATDMGKISLKWQSSSQVEVKL